MSTIPLRPPVDLLLAKALKQMGAGGGIGTNEELAALRKQLDFGVSDILQGIKADTISHEERQITGPAGKLMVSILRPSEPNSSSADTPPGVFYIHGGGLCAGNRFFGIPAVLEWIEAFDAVVVTIEYRLTPEHSQPAQIEDCYAALNWMSEHASELGFSPDKLLVMGSSAGGGLASGLALYSRDHGGPKLCGQLLNCPWIDDSNKSFSLTQYAETLPWPKANSIIALDYAVGEDRKQATIYTAPARATDLSRLPPTFIDVGEADVLRDEGVAYASTLWKSGVSAELHVWPGAWHGFDTFVPDHPTSVRARQARLEWLHRLFDGSD